jgi:hypothetical protein
MLQESSFDSCSDRLTSKELRLEVRQGIYNIICQMTNDATRGLVDDSIKMISGWRVRELYHLVRGLGRAAGGKWSYRV